MSSSFFALGRVTHLGQARFLWASRKLDGPQDADLPLFLQTACEHDLQAPAGATLIGEEELVTRGLAVKARSSCLLASPRLAALGITMRPIEVALRDCLERYAVALHDARDARGGSG